VGSRCWWRGPWASLCCCPRGSKCKQKSSLSQTSATMSRQENPFGEIGWIALAIVSNRVLFAHYYVELTSPLCGFGRCMFWIRPYSFNPENSTQSSGDCEGTQRLTLWHETASGQFVPSRPRKLPSKVPGHEGTPTARLSHPTAQRHAGSGAMTKSQCLTSGDPDFQGSTVAALSNHTSPWR
jgi:hypothetical protein